MPAMRQQVDGTHQYKEKSLKLKPINNSGPFSRPIKVSREMNEHIDIFVL